MATKQINASGKYGVAQDFYITVPDPSDDGRFLDAAVPWVAGDVVVNQDGGTEANIGTLPVRVGSTPVYKISLTAAEMQGTIVTVEPVDATASEAWGDTLLVIETKLRLGQLSVDATQIGSNTNAVEATGVGTGLGLAVAGASDSYKTDIFDQLEGSEPSSAPIADDASVMAMLQWNKRRFLNLNTQSSSEGKIFKDDGTSVLGTKPVSDSGTLQSDGEYV